MTTVPSGGAGNSQLRVANGERTLGPVWPT